MEQISQLQSGHSGLASMSPDQTLALEKAREAFIANRDDNLFFGVHESWEAASAEAAAFGQVGYNNPASASMYDHWTRMHAHDYPALCWLLRSMHDELRRVSDVGGSIGIKFLAFRDALAPWPDLHWTIYDLPVVVAHGRELSALRGDTDRLGFVDQIGDLQDCDVLYTSGVLQYLPRTLGEILSEWQHLPKRIIINTTPIHTDAAFFTVNSIGTAFCPYRVQTQANLIRELTKLSYKVREAWINPDKRMTIPMHPEFSLQNYTGFCLDRKN
jgi:putative methyltransferase (TIGR04325 family)